MVLVSVIIPVYNGEKFIGQCIDSVINQTYEDFELIIINDGSTDKTKKILFEYQDFAIIKHQKNQGISKTLNRGITHASGDYICFLAHDDMWKPEKLDIELKNILNSKYSIVYSDFYKLFGDKSIEVHVHDYNPKILKKFCNINASSCMIDKMCIDNLKEKDGYIFDETLKSAMDWDLWIRLSKFCEFQHVPICLSYYRLHPEQTIRKKIHNSDVRKVYEKYNGEGITGRIYLLVREYIHWLIMINQNRKLKKLSNRCK